MKMIRMMQNCWFICDRPRSAFSVFSANYYLLIFPGSCLFLFSVVIDIYHYLIFQFHSHAFFVFFNQVYSAEAEIRFCDPTTSQLNLPELCALATKHALEADAVFYALPSTVNLGKIRF